MLFSHRSKSTVPGKGVIITNWAKVRPACFAKAAVAAKVSWRSVGSPKMNDPSTCTPCSLKVLSRLARLSPAELKSLKTDFRACVRTRFSCQILRSQCLANAICCGQPSRFLGSHARSEAHLFLRFNASLKAGSSTVEDTATVESP